MRPTGTNGENGGAGMGYEDRGTGVGDEAGAGHEVRQDDAASDVPARAELARAREEVSGRRAAAEEDPATGLPALAGALHRLSDLLSAAGDRTGALPPAKPNSA